MSIAQINLQATIHPSPRMELIMVTPEIAAQWLAGNTKNRRLNSRAVQRIVTEMQSGLFREATGSTIIIDRDKQLQDGQHRLSAIIRSGFSYNMWVLFDADPEDFSVIDIGGAGPRRDSQILQMQGVKDASVLRAAAHSALRMRKLPNVNWSASNTIAGALIRKFVVDHADDLAACATVGYSVERATRISRAQFAAVAFVVSESSVNGIDVWEEFVTHVRNGVLLDDTSPAYALRRWAINYNAPSNSMQKQQTTVSVITKAWNAYVQERPIKVLTYKYGIELPMPLPIPSPR